MRHDLLARPGSSAYRAATTPHNSTAVQQPAVVARPNSAEEVADAVRWAADRNLVVAVQASGHGAGAPIGADQVLIDTSGLDEVSIDAEAGIAHLGAGSTWSAVNSRAEQYGLFGLAGSSPTVAVAGYTFGGGVGWLTRPYGMASSALLAVHFIDGDGRPRRACEDADDPVDRAALWAFRGGGGVGIATRLTVELVAPRALWAGYNCGISLRSSPSPRRGRTPWVNSATRCRPASAYCTPRRVRRFPFVTGGSDRASGVRLTYRPEAAAPLLHALRAAPPPALDSAWAPADSARLAQIHLDPPVRSRPGDRPLAGSHRAAASR